MRTVWLIIGLALGVFLAAAAAGLIQAGDYRTGGLMAAGALFLVLNPVIARTDRLLGPLVADEDEEAELALRRSKRAGRHEVTLPQYVPASYDPLTGAQEPRSATVRVLPLPGHALLGRDGFDCSCGDCMAQAGYWPRRSSSSAPAVGPVQTVTTDATGGRTLHDMAHMANVPGCAYCQAEQRERGQW